MTEIYQAVEFIMEYIEKASNTFFEPYAPIIVVIVSLGIIYKIIVVNIIKGIKKFYGYCSKKRFIINYFVV